jgi:ATP-dependent Clp protease ATP-binding subunit ClpC
MKKISSEAKHFLEYLAMCHISNLFTPEALLIASKEMKVLRQVPSKEQQITADRLFAQLPDGIYMNSKEIIDVIISTVKSINTDSLAYSPMIFSFKEFSSCKTMKYNKGNIITGRDKEIDTILLTLSKKSKRGSILIGDPGVGKTAIVQAISARLIERTVPRQLIGCHILNMDVPYILSKNKEDPIGTIIGILERASEYDKAILFIDEIHQLLNHRMNDILKPYLTEKIRFIGSTTINEYHSIITDDTALERRFTIVHINEPNVHETTEMVIGTKSVFEEHHKCIIPNETCKYLVETGSRFLGHRRNPDKSLDILDIACSIMYENEIKNVSDIEKPNGEYMHDIDIHRKEISTLRQVAGNRTLSDKYVDLAISSVTGVSYEEIKSSTNYNGVLSTLKEGIFGQDKSLEKLANVVNIFKSVNFERERPISVLLMIGPPGSGKRSSASILAKKLFGNKNYFIDYDMSGLRDGFAITELKGSPPGYVGYGKSGGLIKSIRNNPLSVVFFKGIDKAHTDIQQYLLSSCRSGKMVDSAEREAKLNNTILIFSVTIEQEEFNNLIKGNGKSMGFKKDDHLEKDPKKAFKGVLSDELIDLCDEVLIYNGLQKDDLEKIYQSNLDHYLNMYNVKIDLDKLHDYVISGSKNGHDIITKLSSEIPRQVFQKLSIKEAENANTKVKIKVPKINIKNDSNRKAKRVELPPDSRPCE